MLVSAGRLGQSHSSEKITRSFDRDRGGRGPEKKKRRAAGRRPGKAAGPPRVERVFRAQAVGQKMAGSSVKGVTACWPVDSMTERQ